MCAEFMNRFDEEMIEFLFGYAPAGKNRNEAKKESPSNHPSTESIRLIDPEKAESLHYMLRPLNMSTEEVFDALEEGDFFLFPFSFLYLMNSI